jgi:hypothetical protein
MRGLPRRRRARLWAGVYAGLFGTGDDRADDESTTDEVDE